MSTWTDLFAGAGGSSTGITTHGGQVRLAANHWDLAVDVHNANHPDTDHLCADISQYDPRRIPSTECLWASPECTTHSLARSKRDSGPDLFGEVLPDAAVERSRATMWDVVRFAEVHRYRAVVVENVVEIRRWAPYAAWLAAMGSLGYVHRELFVNAMHAQHGGLPAPQSRDRIYVTFWRKGDRTPDFDAVLRPPAWCVRCSGVVESRQAWKPGRTAGKYRAQYVYVCGTCGDVVEPGWLPAAAAIDWSLPGTRIGDRTRPLADKTRARIAAGIARYWTPWILDNNHYNRGRSTSEPMPTMTTATNKALVVPVEGREGKQARPAGDPLRTMTARNETGIALPPFLAELRGGGSTARPVTDPLATVAASGQHHADPLGTLTTRDRYALIMRNNTARGDQGQMSTPVSEPLRTITTAGHQSLVMPYYGNTATADPVTLVTDAAAMVDDCLFRMLEPSEIAAGMAFPDDYQWSGTRRERVRMAGNAVCPPVARDIAAAIHAAYDGVAV